MCYHPLLLFNSQGDCLAAKLRPGNVHSADDWEELLLPEIERQQNNGKEVAFRGDAAFAKPDIYEAAEERGNDARRRAALIKRIVLAGQRCLLRPERGGSLSAKEINAFAFSRLLTGHASTVWLP